MTDEQANTEYARQLSTGVKNLTAAQKAEAFERAVTAAKELDSITISPLIKFNGTKTGPSIIYKVL